MSRRRQGWRAGFRTAGRRVAGAIVAALVLGGCGSTEGSAPVMQDSPGFYQELSWSPDGEILLVSVLEFSDAEPGYTYRIWRVEGDGSGAAPLTDGPRDYWTSWSPGGDRIAFAGVSDSGSLDVFVMQADGTGRRRLTDDPADDTQPAWSPDGRLIAFISDRDERAQIWIMEAGGSDRRRLAAGVWPRWTPDGRRIVFRGEDGLYRILVDGGMAERLLSGNVVAGELSPDGTRLAAIVRDSAAVRVLVSTADGRDTNVLMTRPPPPW